MGEFGSLPVRRVGLAIGYGVHIIMKAFCAAAVLIVFIAGCSSTAAPGNGQVAQAGSGDSDTYILHSTGGANGANGAAADGSASRPPRLTVGVSDPDTQLILPWFLNDVINFVNYR
jgi:hypothetical protein